jgi:hypothetical protein
MRIRLVHFAVLLPVVGAIVWVPSALQPIPAKRLIEMGDGLLERATYYAEGPDQVDRKLVFRAIKCYEDALRQDPQQWEAKEDMAFAYGAMGDKDVARGFVLSVLHDPAVPESDKITVRRQWSAVLGPRPAAPTEPRAPAPGVPTSPGSR